MTFSGALPLPLPPAAAGEVARDVGRSSAGGRVAARERDSNGGRVD